MSSPRCEWSPPRDWTTLRRRPANHPFDKGGYRDASRICQEVPGVESAAEDQVSQRRFPQRVEGRRVKELTQLDRHTNTESHRAANPERGEWCERPDPPEYHRGPQRVADDVARGGTQWDGREVNDQAEGDRRDRQR